MTTAKAKGKAKGKPKATGSGATILYTPETLNEIENAVSDGAKSTKEIADVLGISSASFSNHRYRRDSVTATDRADAIERAIKRGREKNRGSVKRAAEDALLKLITGFEMIDEYEEMKQVKGKKSKDGKEIEPETIIIKRRIRRQYGPNPGAVFFGLVNSDPARWKNLYARSHENSDNDEGSRGAIVAWMNQQTSRGLKISATRGGSDGV